MKPVDFEAVLQMSAALSSTLQEITETTDFACNLYNCCNNS